MAWVSSSFDILPHNNRRNEKCSRSRPTPLKKPSKKICLNLWVDEYPPLSVKDLSVHKKKIEEVQNWLTESGHKVKERRILLLTGPPGSGKSATVHTLSREHNLSLREWTNSDSLKQDYWKESSSNYFIRSQDSSDFSLNQADRFADFIFRSSKYKNICTTSEMASSVILIEEIPNAFTLNPLEFQQIMRKYSASCSTPVIFIISETNNSNNLLKNLFPNEFQEELFITNIVFNPISTTLLTNALTRILNLTNHAKSSVFDSSSLSKKQFFQTVSERSGGDVRSAVNTLQFALMKDDVGVVGGKVKKKVAKDNALVENLIGCKDSSLLLFRALGKILYCKRENASATDNTSLPPHLHQHERKPALENPEDVFERSSTDPATFGLFLHHNCLSFFSRIEDFSAAVHCLGDSDILDSFWEPSNQLKTYCASVAIRGMMHSVSGAPKAAPHTFRSLTRPSWFGFLQTSKERLHRMRHLNKDSAMTAEELASTYVPFLPKICLSPATEVDRFVRDVGLLYPSPPLAQGITRETGHQVSQEMPSEISPDDEDEDFYIEEFGN